MLNELLISYVQQVLVIILVNKLFIKCNSNLLYIGLDVHDCESVSFYEQLQAGNVITIEPGKQFG